MSPAGEANLLDRVRKMGFPAAGGIGPGESAWVLGIPRLNDVRGREVVRELNAQEEFAARERDADARGEYARHAAAVARGEEEPTEEEQALANHERIEAAADLQRHEAERPKRIERRLDEIASSLSAIVEALNRR